MDRVIQLFETKTGKPPPVGDGVLLEEGSPLAERWLSSLKTIRSAIFKAFDESRESVVLDNIDLAKVVGEERIEPGVLQELFRRKLGELLQMTKMGKSVIISSVQIFSRGRIEIDFENPPPEAA